MWGEAELSLGIDEGTRSQMEGCFQPRLRTLPQGLFILLAQDPLHQEEALVIDMASFKKISTRSVSPDNEKRLLLRPGEVVNLDSPI